MKKKLAVLSRYIIVAVCITAILSLNFVYADVDQIIITPNNIQVRGHISDVSQGTDYTVDLYDKNYDSSNPLLSLMYRNQGNSTVGGWWANDINMTGKPGGLYTLRNGDMTGKVTEKKIWFDNFGGRKSYSYDVSAGNDGVLTFKSSSLLTVDFPKAVTDTLTQISFDIKLAGSGSGFYLRLTNAEQANNTNKSQVFDTMIFNNSGVMAMFNEQNNWSFAPGSVEYNRDQTYHIDLWVDMFKRNLTCYVDGKQFGKMNLNDNLNPLCGVILAASMQSAEDSATVSNLKTEVHSQYGETLDMDNVTYPDYIESPVFVSYKANTDVGNIFFDPSNVSFDEAVLNRDSSAATYEVRTKIYNDETGEKVGETVRTQNILGGRTVRNVKKLDMTGFDEQYGLFRMETSFTKIGGKTVLVDKCRFSVARAANEPNLKMGVHTQFGHNYGFADKSIGLMRKAGFSSVRDYVSWTHFNSGNNWALPSRYTDWNSKAQESNMSEILTFSCGDMLESGNDVPKTDAERAKFLEYVSKLATSSDAECFEVFNELNLSSAVSVSNYAQILIEAAKVIHRDAPGKKVVAMATARAGASAQSWIKNVIETMKNWGYNPKDYIDFVSVHPYKLYNLSPETGTLYSAKEYDGTLHEQVSQVRALLDEQGLGDVGIIATEIGWTANPTKSSWALIDNTLSEKGQAQYSVRGSVLLYNDLEKMYWHTLNNKTYESAYEENFGLTKCWTGVEIPYEAKPAFIALSCFNSLLANAEKVKETTTGSVHEAVFDNGGEVRVLWCDSGTADYKMNIGSKIIRMYDMYGNEKIISSDTGVYELNLTESPVYAEVMKDFLEIKLVDEEHSEVTNLTSDKVGAKAISSNGFKAYGNSFKLICAAYKENRLIDVTVKQISGNELDKAEVYTDLLSASNADEIKAFLLNDLIQPLLKRVSINNK